jgi:outer membrane receptor protein involved in Fe transport
MKTARPIVIGACLVLAVVNARAEVDAGKPVPLEIKSQILRDALIDWATQTGIQFIAPQSQAANEVVTQEVKGTLTPKQALDQLLKGTPLTYQWVNKKTVAISIAEPPSQSSAEDYSEPLTEVVVTGTLIRGVPPLVPVTVMTRRQLINQGYTRVDQALQQLPQSFKGGVSSDSGPNNQLGLAGAGNYTYASGVNLRGLGTNATLLLLNGHRVAPSAFGDQVDISRIPISLIERVEVLTDGASATYGADAVAGVVNIITRKNFEGVEAGSRISEASNGKAPNYGANLVLGHQWGTGNFAVDYDYEEDNPLYARNRSFTDTVPDPHSLLPDQKISTVYGSLRQNVSDSVSLSGDLLYGKRTFSVSSSLFSDFSKEDGSAAQLSGNIGATVRLPQDWEVSVMTQLARETDERNVDDVTAGRLTTIDFTNESKSLEIRADGKVIELPSGDIRLAVGALTRKDEFDTHGKNLTTGSANADRTVRSVYGELFVPVLRTLKFSAAGRYDHYSDFSGTFNPKLSLEWNAIEGVAFNGSYGRSFLAPSLYVMSNAINFGYVLNATDPASPSGTRTALLLDGTNPALDAQRSTSYTLGVTFRPPSAAGLDIDVSYFDIDFTDKIERPAALGYFTTVVTSAGILGNLVNLNPTLGQVNAELNAPGRTILSFVGPVTPGQIKAIANIGYVNAAVAHPRGIDASLKYGFDSAIGQINLDFSQTYFVAYSERITPRAPSFTSIDTAYNPLRYRAKLNVEWERGAWGAYSRVNYSKSYRNPGDLNCGNSLGCGVDAAKTLDVGISWAADKIASDALHGLRLSLDVFNALNSSPPFVFNPIGIHYDPTNANPLQRSVAITATKKW